MQNDLKLNRMLSTDNGLVEKLCALIARTLDLPPDLLSAQAETRLYSRGISLDSFDALRLLAALEEEFEITIDDTEITPSTFESIGSVVSLIQTKLVSHP